ncbi:Nucleolar complex protein 3-like [Gracilariopsis chorda]|uniref:Nucleolar complex protein 3-like n=1 Tax=Gracilariopsis chorda TaxID=448386 RepID=A0A2V3J459_9FLOR|nr:Nucleolar complex protein 3-like [Gracilariopsis chorda]|eukprot:PXF48777.1 Nucleolar complex protein 3-like [Gracilariopsis chorda]
MIPAYDSLSHPSAEGKRKPSTGMARKRRNKSRNEDKTPSWEVTRSFKVEESKPPPLPVVQSDGIVKRSKKSRPKFVAKAKSKKKAAELNAVSQQDNDENPPTEGADAEGALSSSAGKRARKRPRQALEKYAEQIEKLEMTKVTVASIAANITSNPQENVGLLKELRSMGRVSRGKVAALILLTESQVYKDIAPGYRIRKITEKEAEVKVSKETKKLRDYEEALLSSYQKFVKSCISLSNWRFSGKAHTAASRNMAVVRFAACKALSELIRSLSHFNEAEVISNVMCAHVCNREEDIRKTSSDALSAVLRNAHKASGQILSLCVSIAKSLASTAGKKQRSAPAELVAPLTEIQFASFARLPISSKRKKESMKGKRLSKVKRRRLMKAKKEEEDKELEKDLREADAEATPQELFGAKKSLLNYVCHAYFNIIRSASSDVDVADDKQPEKVRTRKPPAALSPALKGLLRISAFISSDIIDAILGALCPLLETGRLPLGMRFRCLSAAYAVLGVNARSQKASPDAFTGDTRALDTALYTTLGDLYTPEMPLREDESITYDAVEAMVAATSYRDIPAARNAALSRRLSILASNAPLHSCSIALLYASQSIMPASVVSAIYPQLDENNELRFSNDTGHVSNYRIDINDPDTAGAERSASWELSSLVCSFHPTVRDIAKQCAYGNCGSRLPASSTSVVFKAKAHSNAQGGFNPPPQSELSPNRKRRPLRSEPSAENIDFVMDDELQAINRTLENDELTMRDYLLGRWKARDNENGQAA